MSTKPWEERWTKIEDAIQTPEAEMCAIAAPEMARALLAFRNAHLGQDSAEAIEQALLDAESALAKAGVPL